jgi:hypothetical protein
MRCFMSFDAPRVENMAFAATVAVAAAAGEADQICKRKKIIWVACLAETCCCCCPTHKDKKKRFRTMITGGRGYICRLKRSVDKIEQAFFSRYFSL